MLDWYITIPPDTASAARIERRLQALEDSNERLEKRMADLEFRYREVVQKINVETDRLAGVVTGLKQAVTDALAKSGIPSDVEAAILAEFDAVTARLGSIGKDPEVPIPPVPSEPTPLAQFRRNQ